MGWATPAFETRPGVPFSNGVGDLAESWAVDGARGVLWHNGRIPWRAPRWSSGDVIGVAADLDAGQLWCGHNGDWALCFDAQSGRSEAEVAAAAATGAAVSAGDVGGMLRLSIDSTGIYPAISARDARFSVSCGGPLGADFRHPPPPHLTAARDARPWTPATVRPHLTLLRGSGAPAATPPPLRLGDLVRVRPGLLTPAYGWGALTPSSVGTILLLEGGDCTVDFPEHASWHGKLEDLERVQPSNEDVPVRAHACRHSVPPPPPPRRSVADLLPLPPTLDR